MKENRDLSKSPDRPLETFLYITDTHWGYERVGGHKKPLHDVKAISSMLAFAVDFKPDTVILGGDILDCGAISHHNRTKPGQTEGLKLKADAQECKTALIDRIDALNPTKKIFITGNHEAWLAQLVESLPSLEGMFDIDIILGLDKSWKIIPQGGVYNLGKLTFMHGDSLSGGEHIAKAAVIAYERSVRFGHFHTHQTYSKTSSIDYKNGKTGMAVGCLCGKTPGYGKRRPNRWMQGFLCGYVDPATGLFADFHVTVLDGKCIAPNGQTYRG